MKLRSPRTFAAAMTKIRNALTDDGCADAVGRSASLIRKWADPDHASVPSLEQALLIDVAYVKGGYGEPPIMGIYGELLASSLSEKNNKKVNIVLSTLLLQGIVGDLSESIGRIATSEKTAGEGFLVSDNERKVILNILDRLENEADAIEDAIE